MTHTPIILLLLSLGAAGQSKDTSKISLYSFSTDITKSSGTASFAIQQINSIRIMMNGELVAYRKRDSAWVFLNPNAAIARLDEVAATYGLPPVDSLMQFYKPDTIRPTSAKLVMDSSGKQYWRLPNGNEYACLSCDSSDIPSVQSKDTASITRADTIRCTFTVQYRKGDALTCLDGYLIGGEPYVRVNGRMVKANWYRWTIKQ